MIQWPLWAWHTWAIMGHYDPAIVLLALPRVRVQLGLVCANLAAMIGGPLFTVINGQVCRFSPLSSTMVLLKLWLLNLMMVNDYGV
jgi:hypothetical protein